MIAFTSEELEAVKKAIYNMWQRAAPKSKTLRMLSRLRNRLNEYAHSGSIFTEPCGCEVGMNNGVIHMTRCSLHDAGIDSVKLLAAIVDVAETRGEDDMQDKLDEAQEYLNELTNGSAVTTVRRVRDAASNYTAAISNLERN